MTTTLHSPRRRMIVRRTALALAVAGTGYVIGALVNGPASPREASTAFTRPAQAAEPALRAPLRARQTVAPKTVPPAAADSVQSAGARIQDPRECDVAKGIETACMFMD
jgi:hypothetical protein